MNNIVKKTVTIIVAITCTVWMMGPGVTQALTDDQVQSILNLLNSFGADSATVANVEAALTGAPVTPVTPGDGVGVSCNFTRNLYPGMSGDDVMCLQQYLNDAGFTVADSSYGSPGNETIYFGGLTQAAVQAWQDAHGIAYGAYGGYFGPMSIAKYNELAAAGEEEEEEEEEEEDLPTAEGLTVALSANTPVSTSIISDGANNTAGSQALIPMLKVSFSTPVGTSAKVTTLKLKRLGISSDTDIPNVYLYEGDTKLAEMTSLSSGVVTFTNSAGLFTVSGTKYITVKVDLDKDSTAGKTLGVGINSVDDITTDAAAVNGTFPMNGNLMTVAVVADFGRLTATTSANAATVDPGTTNFEAMKVRLTASNQAIDLYSIKFLQLGSISSSDVANLSLWTGSTQLGSTVESLNSDGTVIFDLSASPYQIPAGVTRTFALKLEVVGGSTRTIQFSIQRSTDIVAKDNNYGFSVAPDVTAVATWSVLDSTACTVNSGSLTISRSTDSPSGNVALNSSNITLAKFDVKAVGENIKVSSLVFAVASTSAWSYINNAKVYFDGIQRGTVQTRQSATTTLSVNFTAPVGVTKTLEIKADIQGDATFGNGDSLKAVFYAGASNAQRMTSLGTFNFPTAMQEGNNLTVTTAALSASKNLSVGNISTVNNVPEVVIGSYLITAGSAEGVDISSITFRSASSSGGIATSTGRAALGDAFDNLKLYLGDTQLGATITTSPGVASTTDYTFYPTGLSLAAGQTVKVDLKANVVSSPTWWNTDNTAIMSIESTGQVTSNAANFATGVAGQGITLTSAGTVSAAIDSSTPETAIAAMGDTDVVLGIWKVSANSIENLTVTQIYVLNNYATSSGNVYNLKMYCGSDQFGVTKAGLISNVTAFGSATGCVVPKGGNKIFTLKGTVTDYASGAQAGEYLEFYVQVPAPPITGVSTDTLVARGAGSYATTTGLSSSTANRVYPYRTSLSVALATHGSASGRTRAATDKVADITLTGTSFADAQFRASNEAADEAITDWVIMTATQTTGAATSNRAVAATTTQKIDGTFSIGFNATCTAATDSWAGVDMGAGDNLQNYAKIGLWIYSNTATGVELFISPDITRADAQASTTASTTLTIATASVWDYFEVNLSDFTGTIDASSRFVGFKVSAAAGAMILYLDNIRFYNDSIALDIGGSIGTTSASTTAWYLKTTGGTQKAVGYFDGATSKVTLIPDAEIAVGSSAITYEIITNSSNMLLVDTTSAETLSISSDLGTYTSAADFRWYDQAVNASSSITWLNGASPISVSLSY